MGATWNPTRLRSAVRRAEERTGTDLLTKRLKKMTDDTTTNTDRPRYAYQTLRTESDRNGNPRRLTVEYDLEDNGRAARVWDHGHRGEPSVRKERRDAGEAVGLSSMYITVAEYNDWLTPTEGGPDVIPS